MEKLAANVRRDRTARMKLTRLGWKYLVIWECEIKTLQRLVRKIICFLSKTSPVKHSLPQPPRETKKSIKDRKIRSE
jgi:DNA mismatch endonuclease (patch repair protein)